MPESNYRREYLRAHRRRDPTAKPHKVRLTEEAWTNFLSQTARLGYNAMSYGRGGVPQYLDALFRHNPSPTIDWTDTRPDFWQEADVPRALIPPPDGPLLPLWYEGDGLRYPTHPRIFPQAEYTRIAAAALTLADHFVIRQRPDLILPDTHPARSPGATVNATLEAIGQGFLSPTHQPQNTHVKNPKNYRPGRDYRQGFGW